MFNISWEFCKFYKCLLFFTFHTVILTRYLNENFTLFAKNAGVDLGGGRSPAPSPNFVAQIFLGDATPMHNVGKILLSPPP